MFYVVIAAYRLHKKKISGKQALLCTHNNKNDNNNTTTNGKGRKANDNGNGCMRPHTKKPGASRRGVGSRALSYYL